MVMLTIRKGGDLKVQEGDRSQIKKLAQVDLNLRGLRRTLPNAVDHWRQCPQWKGRVWCSNTRDELI